MRQDSAGLGRDITIVPTTGATPIRFPLVTDKNGLSWRHEDDIALGGGRPWEPVLKAWEMGFAGGMGETQQFIDGSDGYAFCAGWDATKPGRVKLSGRRNTVAPSATLINAPTFGFEDASSGTAAQTVSRTLRDSGSSTSAAAAIGYRLLTQGSLGSGGPALPVTESTLLEQSFATVSDTYTTTSFTPTASRLIFAAVETQVGTAPILTGNSCNWELVATKTSVNLGVTYRLSVFRAYDAAPSAGTLVITFTGGVVQNYCRVVISEFANTAGTTALNGSDAVTTSATNSGSGDILSVALTFADTANVNATFVAFSTYSEDAGPTAGTGLTEIGTAGLTGKVKTFFADTNVAPAATATGSPVWRGVAIEIAASTATPGTAVFSTANIKPTANRLVVLAVYNTLDAGTVLAPTSVTGGGMTTWTTAAGLTKETADTKKRVTLYRALQASPGAAAPVVITWGVAQTSVRWSIVEFSDVLTTGTNGADAILQDDDATGTSASPSVTISSAITGGNASYGAFLTDGTGGITIGSGYTELHDEENAGELFTEFKAAGSTTVNCTVDSGDAATIWAGVAIEIVAALTSGTYTSAVSFTPTAGSLLLAAVYNNAGTPATPTMTGLNLTWTEVETVTIATYRLTVFSAPVPSTPSPSTGAISIAMGAAQTAVRWSVVEFGNVATSSIVVQSDENSGSGVSSLTVTLASGTSTNATYGVFGASDTAGITPGSGFEQLHEVAATAAELMSEWKSSFDTTVDATLTGVTASALSFATGTYTGDGLTGKQITVAFQPKVVIVKADHATNGHAMIRTDSMSTSQNVTNGTQDAGISALNATGFTVDHVASSTGRTNESGKTYYWYALAGTAIQTGSYTGNGTDFSQTGLGALAMVWVLPNTADNSVMRWRTTDMTTESHHFGNLGGGTADEITSLDVDGFTVGSAAEVNTSTRTYYYVAFTAAANLQVGTYAGNGSDSRNLPASAMAFDPTLVCIKGDGAADCVFKTTDLAGDTSLLYVTGANVADKIQSLTPAPGQFQVGTHVDVNNGALTYFYFALAPDSGGRTWLGVALEIAAGTTPSGITGTLNPYILNQQNCYKMAVDSTPTVTVLETTDFGLNRQAGNPAKFGTDSSSSRWYIPTGRDYSYWTLDAVTSSTGDTWTEAGSAKAQAFARFQDGSTSKLLRGYATNKANINPGTSSGSIEGNWGASAYDVGDTTSLITNMVDTGTSVYVAKTDGLYRFLSEGVAYRIIASQPDDDNGCGLLGIQGTDAVLYNDLAGLWLFDGANLPTLIGPDANDLNQPIANITHEPRGGRHLETAKVGKWFYSIYQVTDSTTKTYILAGYRTGQRWTWHTEWRYDGVVRGVFVDTSQRLWHAFITDQLIGYHQLDEDGCPDPGRNSIGHAAASTTYDFVLSESLWPSKAYLHSVEIFTVNNGATTPVQLQYQADGGSVTSFDSAQEGNGLIRVFKGTTAVGGHRWRLIASVTTTSGYDNTTTSPLEIRAIRPYFWTRPQKSDRIHFTVDCGAPLSSGAMDSDAKTRRDALKALSRGDTSGPAVTCIDPDGGTLYLGMFRAADEALREVDGELRWIMDCVATEWTTASQ